MLALVWFPGFDALLQMAITCFWWGLAVLAAITLLIPVILFVAWLFLLAWCVIRGLEGSP